MYMYTCIRIIVRVTPCHMHIIIEDLVGLCQEYRASLSHLVSVVTPACTALCLHYLTSSAQQSPPHVMMIGSLLDLSLKLPTREHFIIS